MNDIKLIRLDEFNLPKHPDLGKEDVCYYWREYTRGKNYAYSTTNQLIVTFRQACMTTSIFSH